MTNRPQLLLLSHPPTVRNHTPLHTDVDSARLWDLIHDSTVHTILRRSALKELARRNDDGLMMFCEGLISSDTRNDWCLGIDILAEMQTPDAVDRLISAFARALGEDRRYVLNAVAGILTAEYVKPFSIMVRDFAHPGELDITGWTRVAVSTLKDTCRRFGVEVISQAPDTQREPSTRDAEPITFH
ncbi:MAG: hypothetical protein ACTSV3_00625 [Candidatus Thorarchaeota archaeon]|nr:MAG: hypothetical protein DRP09_04225 [Candidatus Thorarchaeota archaeon]RLI60168.1 MAG: hypothetical protein DRO87_00540 [Candidatus Thorarchaeota archaeon]